MSAELRQSVAPLTRKTRGGEVLRRPARIEAEIAATLALGGREILARAAGDDAAGKTMSEECMVHMIRRDLRMSQASPRGGAGGRSLVEELTPVLLARCEAVLKRSIRGFPPSAADEIREDVLGRLAVSLAGPGDEADFLEVRFALALKRLRIDACRRERRRLQGVVALEEVAPAGTSDDSEPPAVDRVPPSPPGQEERLLIRQALRSLTAEERKIVVLHKLAGVPLASKADRGATLVGLLGRSERTLRNRLRSAEAKLLAFRQDRGRSDPSQEARR